MNVFTIYFWQTVSTNNLNLYSNKFIYNDLYIESRFNILQNILYCKKVFANFPLVFIVLYILLKFKREEKKRERERVRNLI